MIRGLFYWIADQVARLFGWVEWDRTILRLEPGIADHSIVVTFLWYLVVIAINTLILIGWGLYNQQRFRGKERRRVMREISVTDLGTLYEFPPEEVQSWQDARLLTMHHDAVGKLTHAEVEPLPPQNPFAEQV